MAGRSLDVVRLEWCMGANMSQSAEGGGWARFCLLMSVFFKASLKVKNEEALVIHDYFQMAYDRLE